MALVALRCYGSASRALCCCCCCLLTTLLCFALATHMMCRVQLGKDVRNGCLVAVKMVDWRRLAHVNEQLQLQREVQVSIRQ